MRHVGYLLLHTPVGNLRRTERYYYLYRPDGTRERFTSLGAAQFRISILRATNARATTKD